MIVNFVHLERYYTLCPGFLRNYAYVRAYYMSYFHEEEDERFIPAEAIVNAYQTACRNMWRELRRHWKNKGLTAENWNDLKRRYNAWQYMLSHLYERRLRRVTKYMEHSGNGGWQSVGDAILADYERLHEMEKKWLFCSREEIDWTVPPDWMIDFQKPGYKRIVGHTY